MFLDNHSWKNVNKVLIFYFQKSSMTTFFHQLFSQMSVKINYDATLVDWKTLMIHSCFWAFHCSCNVIMVSLLDMDFVKECCTFILGYIMLISKKNVELILGTWNRTSKRILPTWKNVESMSIKAKMIDGGLIGMDSTEMCNVGAGNFCLRVDSCFWPGRLMCIFLHWSWFFKI